MTTDLGAACCEQVELAVACVDAFETCSRLDLSDREHVELIAAATATGIAQLWLISLPLTLAALDLELAAAHEKAPA